MENWFGLECHPTDSFVHWSESIKNRMHNAIKLRSAYDRLVGEDKQRIKDFELLVEAAQSIAKKDRWEQEGN